MRIAYVVYPDFTGLDLVGPVPNEPLRVRYPTLAAPPNRTGWLR